MSEMNRLLQHFILALLIAVISRPVSAWEYLENKDDFDDTVFKYIKSEYVKPNRPLSWPNSDPVVYLYYQCNNQFFVLRNSANNLNDGASEDGWTRYNFRAKINEGTIFEITALNDWGSEYFLLQDKFLISRFSNEGVQSLLIELDHFGDGRRHYKFDITELDTSQCDQ